MTSHKPKLLDQVRAAIRLRHYSIHTETAYVDWIKRYIFFHHKRRPAEMGSAEIDAFLSHLATEKNVAASTQNQARSALLFLYRYVLGREGELPLDPVQAKKPKRLPTVLSQDEARRVIAGLSGQEQLIVQLLYGGGLRLIECLRLRIKDLDFEQQHILVRDGKGEKDRVTLLPA